MPEQERLFFTFDEALESVRMAFAQYPSQLNLLSVLWPMIFDDRAYVLQDARNRSVWAKIPGNTKLIPTSEGDLKKRIVEQLRQMPPDPGHLARICSLVFGAHAYTGSGPQSASSPGIWIDTDMADFVCTRCGHCCRSLSFHDGCTTIDYHRWQELGRTDILDWVGTVRHDGHLVACRIWIVPRTNRYAGTCPWLEKLPDRDRYACAIHTVRPTICRQYPGSRKHARMTGCRGV